MDESQRMMLERARKHRHVLTDWERGFIDYLQEQPAHYKLSRRQSDTLMTTIRIKLDAARS